MSLYTRISKRLGCQLWAQWLFANVHSCQLCLRTFIMHLISVLSVSLCYVHLLQSVLTFLWHKSCKKAATFSFPYSCFWVCRHLSEWRGTKKALTQAYTRATGELELHVYVFIVLVVVPLVWRDFNCLELAAWAPSPEYLADAKEERQEQSEPRLAYGSQVIPLLQMNDRKISFPVSLLEWSDREQRIHY